MKFLFASLLAAAFSVPAPGSALRSDESIIFYPTYAWQSNGTWQVQVRGWVHEPESRPVLGPLLRRAIGIDRDKLTEAERKIYRERTRFFLPDNERGKVVTVCAGDQRCVLPASGANGHFSMDWQLSAGEFAALPVTDRTLTIRAILEANDSRAFLASIHVLSNKGVSVISDIDDTIKISEVRSREALLLNTFCRPFAAAPGMAELYRHWAKAGAQFHYVSASPWQLYPPLAQFVADAGFPPGTFHMKHFRVKDSTFLALFDDPKTYKLRVLKPMLERFPERRFILIGDSGEKDPEIYGEVTRQFGDRIAAIYIRNVSGEDQTSSRYQAAFSGVSPSVWRIFDNPKTLSTNDLLLSRAL